MGGGIAVVVGAGAGAVVVAGDGAAVVVGAGAGVLPAGGVVVAAAGTGVVVAGSGVVVGRALVQPNRPARNRTATGMAIHLADNLFTSSSSPPNVGFFISF
jgi:hypothetical protein